MKITDDYMHELCGMNEIATKETNHNYMYQRQRNLKKNLVNANNHEDPINSRLLEENSFIFDYKGEKLINKKKIFS